MYIAGVLEGRLGIILAYQAGKDNRVHFIQSRKPDVDILRIVSCLPSQVLILKCSICPGAPLQNVTYTAICFGVRV